MTDARHQQTNVIRRGSRRSAPTHQMKATHRNDPAVWRAHNSPTHQKKVSHRTDPAIWRAQNDAQRRNQYGDEEDESSDEYDDDFDLNIPVVAPLKPEASSRPVSKKAVSPQKDLYLQTRKKSFSNAVHPRSVHYNPQEGSNNNLFVVRQSRSSLSYPTQKPPLHMQKEDCLPALTPAEAIRLVMERHTYVSDSDRAGDSDRVDDPVPLLSRKSSRSTSTNGTATLTVHSSSSINETSSKTLTSNSSPKRRAQGKRVLALKKKKFREDTHPTTSKNKNYHQKNPQDSPLRQQEKPAYQLPSERRREREAKQRAAASRIEKAESSRQHEHSTPNDSRTSLEQYQNRYSNEYIDGNCVFGNVQVKVDDNQDKTKDVSNKSFQSAGFFEKLSNTKPKQRTPPPSLVVDISENDYGSESESNGNEIDCWAGHEDNTQRPSNRSTMVDTSHDLTIDSMLEKEDDKDDDIHSSVNLEDDSDKNTSWKTADDDWRNMSWKTAKTSKSVLSKYSKNSSVALWMKHMEEENSVDIDEDDIYFFDAIQEAGKTSSSGSVSTSDGSESKDDPEDSDEEDEGWTGKITNFVGYTIGALTGSKDEGDDSSEDKDEVGTIPAVVTPEKPFVPSTRKGSMTSNRSASSTKTVPSRELEIIRKCQELMTSQRNLMENREKELAQRTKEDIRLQRMEDAARAKVRREVMAYREMMEGMGKGSKLAPLDRKAAAQDYDDRLSMGKTLEDQEMKMRLHERNMIELDNLGKSSNGKSCGCSCTIS